MTPTLHKPSSVAGTCMSDMAPTVPEFTPDVANCDKVVQALIEGGGVFIRGLLSPSTLDTIEKDVRPYLEADRPWQGDFFPPETRRVCGLAGKSTAFTRNVVANPLYQAVCDKLLTSEFKSFLGQKVETSTSSPQLNNTIVFSIGPGARNQELHRDDMIHHNPLTAITPEEYRIGRDTGIGFFVAGKKTTRANGATRFIPGSHLWDGMVPPDEALSVYAELSPGDAFIMLSSCFHGGSANTTTNEERLIYSCFMTKGYLRQVSPLPWHNVYPFFLLTLQICRKKINTWQTLSTRYASIRKTCRSSSDTRSATRSWDGWTSAILAKLCTETTGKPPEVIYMTRRANSLISHPREARLSWKLNTVLPLPPSAWTVLPRSRKHDTPDPDARRNPVTNRIGMINGNACILGHAAVLCV